MHYVVWLVHCASQAGARKLSAESTFFALCAGAGLMSLRWVVSVHCASQAGWLYALLVSSSCCTAACCVCGPSALLRQGWSSSALHLIGPPSLPSCPLVAPRSYFQQGTRQQLLAANALKAQGWRFHTQVG